MKLYLMTDVEGVAGVYEWEDRQSKTRDSHERRMRERRWLGQEVGAAVDGLLAGGATEVLVNDGHGAGYAADLDFVDPRAQVFNGRDRPFWLHGLDETCAATRIVGAHAKASTPGACLCHTMYGGVLDWTFNGISLGEVGLQAAIAGHYGVPFVFVTGDAHACLQMDELIPGVVSVPVKTGTSMYSTITWPPARAREMIREGAERAMRVVGEVQPFRLESPILFRDERTRPAFDERNPPPGSRVISPRVREIEATDILDLMEKLRGHTRAWNPM